MKRAMAIASVVNDGQELGLFIPVEIESSVTCNDPHIGLPIKQVLGFGENMVYATKEDALIVIVGQLRSAFNKEEAECIEVSYFSGDFYTDFRNIFYSEVVIGAARISSISSVPTAKIYRNKEDVRYDIR